MRSKPRFQFEKRGFLYLMAGLVLNFFERKIHGSRVYPTKARLARLQCGGSV